MMEKHKILAIFHNFFLKQNFYIYVRQRTLNSTKCILVSFVLQTTITLTYHRTRSFTIPSKLIEIFLKYVKNIFFYWKSLFLKIFEYTYETVSLSHSAWILVQNTISKYEKHSDKISLKIFYVMKFIIT